MKSNRPKLSIEMIELINHLCFLMGEIPSDLINIRSKLHFLIQSLENFPIYLLTDELVQVVKDTLETANDFLVETAKSYYEANNPDAEKMNDIKKSVGKLNQFSVGTIDTLLLSQGINNLMAESRKSLEQMISQY